MLDDQTDNDEVKGSLAKQRLERLKEWDFNRTPVQHSGKMITLPADPGQMDLRVAAAHLIKLVEEEEMIVDVMETIPCFPFDGLVAINKALAYLFGWASPVPTPSFFGPIPPEIISVQTSYSDWQQVPMGEFTIPAFPDKYRVKVGMNNDSMNPFVFISSKLPRKYERVIRLIGKTAKEFLHNESIYKGKSIKLHTKNKVVDYSKQPEFFYTGAVVESDLHLNDDVMQMVETNILTPIKHKEACLAMKVPLKRGVLLEGPFGVGKTLISTITSKIANQNQWTFILIEDVTALRSALELAKRYQPCVVFAEDLDRIVTLERDEAANEILNTIDGVLSKDAAVMVVFTTNHVEKISKAMLRPGRLDAVISVTPPNEKTCAALIHYYGRGLVAKDEDITEACDVLAGQIPATIREVVERSKLHGIPRISNGQPPMINGIDLLVTANQMTRHLALLNGPSKVDTVEERFGKSFKELVGNAQVGGALDKLVKKDDLREINEFTEVQANRVISATEEMTPSQDTLIETTAAGMLKVAKSSRTNIKLAG